MSDVASTVKEIIVEKLGVKESEVTPEANFTNDLGADSLDTVEMIMEFETKFDIKIARFFRYSCQISSALASFSSKCAINCSNVWCVSSVNTLAAQ